MNDLSQLVRRVPDNVSKRYSLPRLALRYKADWNFDFGKVRRRIATMATAREFAELFHDIVCQDPVAVRWYKHPDARSRLKAATEKLVSAWDNFLIHEPERDSVVLEYLSDALSDFKLAFNR